jgi:hypothetical protein
MDVLRSEFLQNSKLTILVKPAAGISKSVFDKYFAIISTVGRIVPYSHLTVINESLTTTYNLYQKMDKNSFILFNFVQNQREIGSDLLLSSNILGVLSVAHFPSLTIPFNFFEISKYDSELLSKHPSCLVRKFFLFEPNTDENIKGVDLIPILDDEQLKFYIYNQILTFASEMITSLSLVAAATENKTSFSVPLSEQPLKSMKLAVTIDDLSVDSRTSSQDYLNYTRLSADFDDEQEISSSFNISNSDNKALSVNISGGNLQRPQSRQECHTQNSNVVSPTDDTQKVLESSVLFLEASKLKKKSPGRSTKVISDILLACGCWTVASSR